MPRWTKKTKEIESKRKKGKTKETEGRNRKMAKNRKRKMKRDDIYREENERTNYEYELNSRANLRRVVVSANQSLGRLIPPLPSLLHPLCLFLVLVVPRISSPTCLTMPDSYELLKRRPFAKNSICTQMKGHRLRLLLSSLFFSLPHFNSTLRRNPVIATQSVSLGRHFRNAMTPTNRPRNASTS